MGPFPASIHVLCNPVRPYFSAAGNALVREGARNLVVILWKSKFLLARLPRRMQPVIRHAPVGAKCFQFNNKAAFLVHEAAHTDIHHNPQRQEHEQY